MPNEGKPVRKHKQESVKISIKKNKQNIQPIIHENWQMIQQNPSKSKEDNPFAKTLLGPTDSSKFVS